MKTTKKIRIKDPVARAEARYKNALQKIRTSQPLSKKEFQELARRGQTINMPRIVERNKTGKNKKLVTTISTTNKALTFSYSPKKARTNAIPKNNSNKKTSSTTSFRFDSNDPVSELKARNIEFGHGRKKSQEWNDEAAKKLQKELKKQREKNPDWTDRFALK